MLTSKGWDPKLAEQLCLHSPTESIPDTLRQEVASIAMDHYGHDVNKVRAAWEGTGFTPQPALPQNVRPKPNGLQLLRFLSKITLSK